MSFTDFFQTATGNSPYEYRRRLACGEPGHRCKADWLTASTNADSRLINIPTGLRKTVAK